MKKITKWKRTTGVFLATCFYLLQTTHIQANNLQISNIVNPGAGTTITFDVTWDNSWWTSTGTANYDAVWVFIKNQNCPYPTSPTAITPVWNAVSVSTVSGDHTINSSNLPITIDAVADGMGVFIHQTSAQLSGSVSAKVTLKLSAAAANYTWKVFGIEMAYIPQASFTVGDGSGTTSNPFTNQSIASENAITAATLGGTGTVDLPASYPKGYDAFYAMKQEISQAQYKDFLNTLTYDQQINRSTQLPNYFSSSIPYPWALTAPAAGPYNRNGIKIETVGSNNFLPAVYSCNLNNDVTSNSIGDGQDIVCNYLSWADVASFLDWAALRPMTEMEYEKICRGTVASLADEYAWGSTAINAATSAAIVGGSAGTISEASTARPADGLSVYGNAAATGGPFRGGASTTSSSTRITAAAAYYGPLDMAGNIWEQVVCVNVNGATFTGTLGNGVVDVSGNADVVNWPANATGLGSGSRGGSWYTQVANVSYLRTSDRTNALTPNTTRSIEHGGRGVR